MTGSRGQDRSGQGSRVDVDLVFEVDDGRGRSTAGTVSTERPGEAAGEPGGRVVVEVDDPVALFSALPSRLERGAVDTAGQLLSPAPVVELRAAGHRLAALDVTARSPLGRLLGDERLLLTPRGALAAARGRAPHPALLSAAALVLLAVLLGGRRRR